MNRPMAMSPQKNMKKNIVMFPLMAHGHIIPFLALAHQIQKSKNDYYTITLVNTPQNISKLRRSLPSNNSNIGFLEIPFSSSDRGLPPNIESTDAIPFHLIPTFLQATLSLKPSFRKLISDLISEQNGHLHQQPLCIVADMFFGWTADIAHEFGLFHAIFCGGCGFGIGCYFSLWLNLPHRGTDSQEFELPDFPEARGIHITQMAENLRLANGSENFSIFLKKGLLEWRNSDGILFNTVEELDKTGLMYFRRKIGRPVWAIGPVISMGSQARAAKEEAGITPEMCNKWLNTKPFNSVLYISFGSQYTLSASQTMDLALALEASGRNFIWVCRPPNGFEKQNEFEAKDWLPDGFEERIKESRRGLLVHHWAPQVEILSHESVSAFLSHCGWNSVLEALCHGKLILGWPLAAEQCYNAKFLKQEVGVCVEVARGQSCKVRHEDLVAKIELVMNDQTEKGREMRRKACEVMDMIRNAIKDDHEDDFKGSSVKAMEEFLNAAELRVRKTAKGKPNFET